MKVCDLTRREAVDLVRHKTIPDCKKHCHITRKEAERMVADGTFEYLDGTEFRGQRRRPRTWRATRSGRAREKVMQLVEVKGRRKSA